jgi:hypothetical protein
MGACKQAQKLGVMERLCQPCGAMPVSSCPKIIHIRALPPRYHRQHLWFWSHSFNAAAAAAGAVWWLLQAALLTLCWHDRQRMPLLYSRLHIAPSNPV